MEKKCNLNKLFNELGVSVRLEIYGARTFNGFYKPESYNKHLNLMVENFKHDMCYQLAFEKEAEKQVLLRNLFNGLNNSKRLKELQSVMVKNLCRFNIRFFGAIQDIISKRSCKRLRYMFFKQRMSINQMLKIVYDSANSFEVELFPNKSLAVKTGIAKWNGTPLEFLQHYYASIYSGLIVVEAKNEKQGAIEMAKYYGLKISEKDFSSLSHAIHSNNFDYEPELFSNMIKGYRKLEVKRRENNKKK